MPYFRPFGTEIVILIPACAELFQASKRERFQIRSAATRNPWCGEVRRVEGCLQSFLVHRHELLSAVNLFLNKCRHLPRVDRIRKHAAHKPSNLPHPLAHRPLLVVAVGAVPLQYV